MNIHKVEITNFLSFKKTTTFKLSGRGLCLIVGYNNDSVDGNNNGDIKSSNGAGKSALISSVLWALYGNLDRTPDKKDNVINRDAQKNCCVTLHFDDCVVSRGRKPDFLRFWVGGIEQTRGTTTDTQQLLENYIGIPFEVFKNSYVLSGDTVSSFMAKPKSQRREFIEKMFGFTEFDTYLYQTRDMIRNESDVYNSKMNILAHMEHQRKKILEKIELLKQNSTQWDATKDSEIDLCKTHLDKLYKYDLAEYAKKRKKINDIDMRIQGINFAIKSLMNINRSISESVMTEH